MQTNIVGEKAAMSDVAHMAHALVRKAEYQCGSLMLAYERVGQMVGMSSSWVRSLIHGYGGAEPRYTTAMNIKAAYERTCITIERKAQRIEEMNAAHSRASATGEGLGE